MEQQENYVTMDCVRIDKRRLMDKVRENRASHETAYNEAVEAYKVVVINKIQERLQDEKAKYEKLVARILEESTNFEKDPSINLQWVMVTKPISYLEDYDTAISMLDFSLDRVAELDRQEFQSCVMDNWEWKKDFININNTMITGSAFYNSIK